MQETVAVLLLKFINISKGDLNCKLFKKLSGHNVLGWGKDVLLGLRDVFVP